MRRTVRGNGCWALGWALLVVTAAVVTAEAGTTGKTKDTAVVAAQRGNTPIPVLVRIDTEAIETVAATLKARGAAIERRLPGASALRITLHPKDFDAVLALPGVRGLSADATVRAAGASKKSGSSFTTTSKTTDSTTSTATATTASWSTWFADWSASTQQSSALFGALGTQWTTAKGAGVRVAIIDSGIDGAAPEFAGRVVDFYDFTSGGRRVTATDAYGHGTHIAGLIGAAGSTFRGVAPEVEFIGLKVLDATGQGRTSDVLAALEFVTQNKRRLGIDIVNLSMGHPILEPAATDPLVQAVERAVAAGLIVVASAGNIGQHPETMAIGYAGITSPGNAPSAITAGSLDLHGTADRRDDTVSPFSSRGPTWYDGLVKPDIVSPGHGLFAVNADGSTLGTSSTLSSSGAAAKLYGTSMAAATTTGVVALLLESNRTAFPEAGRDLPANAVKAVLQYTSVAVQEAAAGADYDLLTAGAGGINALGAITLASRLDPGAPSGTWWLTTGLDERTTLAGVATPWTRRIIWGDTVLNGQGIYANAPAWQADIVWGDTLVWGDSLVWGDLFIWGENVVSATAFVWSESVVWGDGLVTIDGQSLVWGDTLIWGESLVWGDTLIWGASTTP